MRQLTDSDFFMDHASELCCVIGPDGRFEYANLAWQRLLGWDRDALIGTAIEDLVHPDDIESTRAASNAAARNARQGFFINRYRARDGAYRWFEWRFAQPAQGGAIQALARDVTETQRQSSHARIIEKTARIATWEINLDTGTLYWSPQAFALHEVDPAEYEPDPRTALDFFLPEGRETMREAVRALRKSGKGFDLELPLRTARGRDIWVRISGRTERRPGMPERIYGTIRDATEERQQRRWLERLGAVARHTTNAVILLDTEGCIEWANPAFARQSLYSRRETQGQPIERFNAEMDPAFRAAIKAARSTRLELKRRRKDGGHYWVDLDIEPLHGPNGVREGFILVETDITESKRNAERLQALERDARAAHDRLLEAVDALPDAFVLFDSEDRLVMWNNRYAEFYDCASDIFRPGVTFEQIERHALAVGQLPDAVGHEEDWLARRLAVRTRGGTFDQRLPDGRCIRTVERRTSSGELVAFHVDITELKHQQEEAQEARKALQDTLDALPDLLFDLDLDGVYHDARSGNPALFHVPAEDHIGARVEEILPPWVAAMWRGALHEAHTRGQVRGLEYTLELEGGTRWFELSVSCKNDAQQTPPRFIVAARDISERKSAEAARVQKEAELKRALAARDAAESRFYEIASVSHDWFWEQDAEGRFTYMSESISQMPGRAPELYIGRTREEVAALVGDGDGVDWSFVNERMAARQPFQDFVYPQNIDDGRTLWVRISGAPFYDEAGDYAGYRGVGSDVTALRDAQARAEEASAAKSRFLANMSHEVRTPLNGIIGLAGILEETLQDADSRNSAAVIRDSGETLVTILNDILDLSKIEAGQLSLEVSQFRPDDLADKVVALHRHRTQSKGVALHALPGSGADRPRAGDGHRILQILHNLVGNAVKFTEAGEIRVTLDCADPERLTIVVSDTGIGMSESQMASIFDEFAQGGMAITRQYGGTGLGMSICKRLAELMDGSVTVESEPGAGTEVRVALRIPLHEAEPADRQVEAEHLARLDGLRVLAADDNGTNRLLLEKFLARLGVEVRLAASGEEAVAAADSEAFDVLLLDIRMPDINGDEALRRIRARPAPAHNSDVPAIAVTANAMTHQIDDYLAQGFAAHVSKPIRLEDLAAAIRRAVPDPATIP